MLYISACMEPLEKMTGFNVDLEKLVLLAKKCTQSSVGKKMATGAFTHCSYRMKTLTTFIKMY